MVESANAWSTGMPIKRAAARQLRKDRQRAQRNQATLSELKTLKKQVRTLLAKQKREEALQLMPVVMRRFAQAGAKGVIHKNTASRVTARLMRLLAHGQPVRLPAAQVTKVSTARPSTPLAPPGGSSAPS